ncbi:hypothetical protein [Dysgonomonas sp. 511]|uniref:hypothetical protein n=1 Tax=Dysgonomonas sp. 511 TaxID=2302930 RepID=UPI0013D6729D|nr:hypothetical protein [Dysgonomonas sp. 511]NDV80047.1 hypothetical protein [Dysgonomonas sp. 511]
MPRQDIHADAIYGDVNLTDQLTNKTLYEFVFLEEVEGLDNEKYCYGEVVIASPNQSNAYVQTPYIPCYKELKIRFRIDNGDGAPEYIINKTDNKHWFPVSLKFDGKERTIHLAEYRNINEKGIFNLIFDSVELLLYSGDETDFIIKAALTQNETFLLKAFSGNLYQYPTTGVGLIDFLHGNFENTGQAAKLQQEFEKDKMIINNAYMNSSTGELLLDVTEKNG